jgi:uncharacterized membrane protein
MRTERGFHRLVNFSDAVVAIAITLLVLPLVDSASRIGGTDVHVFLRENWHQIFAFALSFLVIANFWWAQHQMFEQVRSYNTGLVVAMFLWLFAIVILPFPTELLGSTRRTDTTTHAVYIGTILLAAVAGLIQQWIIVRWPELQDEAHRGEVFVDNAAIVVGLLAVALLLTLLLPKVGLWSLLVLVLERPIQQMARRGRARQAG